MADELPRVVTTGDLRERGFDLPAVAPEILHNLHPFGRHLAFEVTVFNDFEPPDVILCTVLAVTEREDIVRFLHQFRNRDWDALPTVDRLLIDVARQAEEAAIRSVVTGLEHCLRADLGFQQELPFG